MLLLSLLWACAVCVPYTPWRNQSERLTLDPRKGRVAQLDYG